VDNNRLAAFTLRGSAGNFEKALNRIDAASIQDPIQRQLTIARVRDIAAQAAVWLKAADPKPAASEPLKPLTQKSPAPSPEADTHK